MTETKDTGQTEQGTVSDETGLNGLTCCDLLSPYYSDDYVTIYHGECEKIVPHLGKFDLLLTDPPYGLGEKLKSGTRGEWSKGFAVNPAWDLETVPEWLIGQMVAKCDHSIVWGGNYYDLPKTRGWIGWDKMQDHSSGHYELAWTNLDIPTRMYRKSRVEAYGSMNKSHPTQKPIALMQWCMNLVSECRTILDPFGGSGTTGEAAKALGKKAVLIEREERYCEIAAQRMLQEVLPLNEPTKAHHEVQEELFQR